MKKFIAHIILIFLVPIHLIVFKHFITVENVYKLVRGLGKVFCGYCHG